MAARGQVLQLYKTMLREAGKFPDFNFRSYALRRVRDGFKTGKSLQDSEAIAAQILEAENNLQVIKRQATLGSLFDIQQPLSIEIAQKQSKQC